MGKENQNNWYIFLIYHYASEYFFAALYILSYQSFLPFPKRKLIIKIPFSYYTISVTSKLGLIQQYQDDESLFMPI